MILKPARLRGVLLYQAVLVFLYYFSRVCYCFYVVLRIGLLTFETSNLFTQHLLKRAFFSWHVSLWSVLLICGHLWIRWLCSTFKVQPDFI